MKQLRFGALAVVLAVCSPTSQADPVPVAPPVGMPVPEKRPRPLAIDKPVVVLAPQFNAKPPEAAPAFNPLYEFTSVFIIVMFTAGGVVALTGVAHFFFRIAAPMHPRVLVLNDPWVRANLARLEAAPPDDAPAVTGQ